MLTQQRHLRDLQNNLQRRIDEARHLRDLQQRGELPNPSPEQARLIADYPSYLADLAKLKAGQIPANPTKPTPKSKRTPARVDQPQPSGTPARVGQPQPSGTPAPSEAVPHVQQAATATKHGSIGGGNPAAAPGTTTMKPKMPPVGARSKHERLLLSLVAAQGDERKALIERHVESSLDRKRLSALTKEYESVCALRKAILDGTIEQPTRLQQSKVQLCEDLRKELEGERVALASQASRIRLLLVAELCELEPTVEQDVDALVEAPVADTVSAAASSGTLSSGAPPTHEGGHQESAPTAVEEEQHTPTAPVPSRDDEATRTEKTPVPPHISSPVVEPNDLPVPDAVVDEGIASEDAPAAVPSVDSCDGTPRVIQHVSDPPAHVSDEGSSDAAPHDHSVDAAAAENKQADGDAAAKVEADWSTVVVTRNRRGRRDQAPHADTTAASPATPAIPTAMPSLLFEGQQVASTQGAARKRPPATTAVAPQRPSSTAGFRQTAAAKLAREYASLQASPLPYVGVCLIEEDLFRWSINIAVGEGPLAGTIIPVEASFSDFFPSEPPAMKLLVDIPHPSVVVAAHSRLALCMEHTGVSAGEGWSPAYGAFSLLSQLQSFFNQENIAAMERTLGSRVFEARIRSARIAAACHTNPATGHAPTRPVPPVPFVNGPMRHSPDAVLCTHGFIQCRAKGEGNSWAHAFGRSGIHTVRVLIRQGTALIGVTVDPELIDMSLLGEARGSWVLDTTTGSVWSEGHEQPPAADSAVAAMFPLPPFSTVDVVVDARCGTLNFMVNGTEVGAVAALPPAEPIIPAYCLLSAGAAIEFTVYIEGVPLPAAPGPAGIPLERQLSASADTSMCSTAASPVSLAASEPLPDGGAEHALLACCVTLAGQSEAVIGVGIEVSKRHRSFLPAEIRHTRTYVSLEAFPRVAGTRAPGNGARFDFALPLLLDSAHSVRSLPALKSCLMRIARNPSASTLYEPPFRPAVVGGILSEALRGIVRETVHATAPDWRAAFVLYTRLTHGFAALALEHPSIVTEARGVMTLGEASSTVIFALSPIVVDLPWPEVVRLALQAEIDGSREPTSTDEAFASLRRALPKLLLSGAMACTLRCATLQRAVELFAANNGGPTAEMVQAFWRAMASRAAVTSWDALCDFFNVFISLDDVVRSTKGP